MSDRPVKVVELSRVYAAHDEAIKAVRLKEPTADDYLDLGEIFELQHSADGAEVVIERPEVLRGYVERCVDGVDFAIVGTFGLKDGRALRSAMLDFFRAAAPSDGASTTSSSPSDGAPATSAP